MIAGCSESCYHRQLPLSPSVYMQFPPVDIESKHLAIFTIFLLLKIGKYETFLNDFRTILKEKIFLQPEMLIEFLL